MVAPLVVFGLLASVLSYAVVGYWRLPGDELVRRLRFAGTGRLLRAITLASPGLCLSMLLATALMALLLLIGDTIEAWERIVLGAVGLGSLTFGALSILAAFTGRPKLMLFPQARDRQVREAVQKK